MSPLSKQRHLACLAMRMRRLAACSLSIFLAMLVNPVQALAAEDSIDAFIRAEMQTQKIPGVAVAIMRWQASSERKEAA